MLKTTERARLDEIRLAHQPDIKIGAALLQPAIRQLVSDGRSQPLEPRVAQLLVALARSPNEVASRDDLVDLCWGGRIVGEDAVNRCVAKARKVAADAGFRIETIPKIGYRLVTCEPAARPLSNRRYWLLAALSAVVVAAGLALFYGPSRVGPDRSQLPSIAVAQFTTSSSDPLLQARTADVAPQVVNALLKVGFATISSVEANPGSAQYVLRGRISRRSDGISGVVQLDDPRSGMTIMSQDVDLDPDEVSLLPDKVAAVAADTATQAGVAYSLTLKSADREEIGRFLGIESQIASGDYLEAEFGARQFFDSHPRSRLAPFALTHASIYALPLLPMSQRREAIIRARSASRLALQRLPEFGDVYIARCKLYPVDYWACEQAVRRGLAVDQAAPTLEAQLALLLMDAGRLREARPLMDKALAQNPFNPSRVIQSLYLAELTGDRTKESYLWSYAQQYWPRVRFARQRFVSLMANGRWRESEAMVPLVLRVAPGWQAGLTAMFAALHRPSAERVARVEAECRRAPETGLGVPCVAALSTLGRMDGAIDAARRSYPRLKAIRPGVEEQLFLANGSDPGPLFFVWGEAAKPMRREPAFASFAAQVGLVPYWAKRGLPDLCRSDRPPFCKIASSR